MASQLCGIFVCGHAHTRTYAVDAKQKYIYTYADICMRASVHEFDAVLLPHMFATDRPNASVWTMQFCISDK